MAEEAAAAYAEAQLSLRHKLSAAVAGEAGNAEAPINLGVCYFKGVGVAADSRAAVKWFLRAAEAGHAVAQRNLGVCYAKGEGIACDFAAARSWLTRAAAAGDAKAPRLLEWLDAIEAAQ